MLGYSNGTNLISYTRAGGFCQLSQAFHSRDFKSTIQIADLATTNLTKKENKLKRIDLRGNQRLQKIIVAGNCVNSYNQQ